MAQGSIFIPLDIFAGHLISAVVILLINIGLAASYRSENPYLMGARWSAFFNLSWASYARHEYWYTSMLESFVRLRDFNRPLAWDQVLCQAPPEAILVTGVTSVLLVLFYYLTPKWPEWHGRWEMLRRAPFSASLGFQAIIVTTVVYPTPLAMSLALFFASVISPIIRRQIRLNHVVFMMLVPLFSLGCPPLAAFWAGVTGFLFLYAVSVERSFTVYTASFSFFNGVTFLALVVSMSQDRINGLGNPVLAGLYSLLCFVLVLGISYVLLFRGDGAVRAIRRAQLALTPRPLRDSSWWHIRDLWVDREVAHRVGKLYKFKEQEKTIGYFFFGPRLWAPRSEAYDRVPYPRLNLTPAILVLAFYSIWFGVDTVLFLTTGARSVTITGLVASFALVLLAPILLLAKQARDRGHFQLISILTSCFAIFIFLAFMTSTLYFGLTSTDRAATAAERLEARTAGPVTTSGIAPGDCSCHHVDEPIKFMDL